VEICDKITYNTEKWNEDDVIIRISDCKLNERYC